MKISIVTVTYNCASILENTILSVINQTYQNVEYIIIDGQSNDGTVDIIKKYENKISYWISEKDCGIYDAMNKGILASTGSWINFMNAGDVFNDCDVIRDLFSKKIVNSFDVLYGDNQVRYFHGYKYNKANMPFFEKKTWFRSMGYNHQASFVKVALAKKYLFDLSFKLCADYNMMNQLFCDGYRFYYCNRVIAITEGREGASARSRNLQRREEARVCEVEHSFFFKVWFVYKNIRTFFKQYLLR